MYGFYENFIHQVEYEEKCSDCYGLSPLIESKEDTDDEEERENKKDRIDVDEVLKEEGFYIYKNCIVHFEEII